MFYTFILRNTGIQEYKRKALSNNKELRDYRSKFEGHLILMLTSRNDDVTQPISDVDPSIHHIEMRHREEVRSPSQWNQWGRWSELLPVKTTRPKLFKCFICTISIFMRWTLVIYLRSW